MENRIRELRKSHNLAQEALGIILGTTQQAISRMENADYNIPADLLVNLSKRFNVTTDYILGISDIKRDLSRQVLMNQEIDQYYNIVRRFQQLDCINQKTFYLFLERLEQTQIERESLQKEVLQKKKKGGGEC